MTLSRLVKYVLTLSRLKRKESNNNVADFFIDANEFICPYLCTIFNNVYDSGIYPEAWSKCAIVPILKKGDIHNPSNYRGITLINILAKIFSLLLRNRINKWCESENVLNDSQFGFMDNRSTTDAIFLLHTIIQKVLSTNSRLFCIFIDYKKAFDTVNRDALYG